MKCVKKANTVEPLQNGTHHFVRYTRVSFIEPQRGSTQTLVCWLLGYGRKLNAVHGPGVTLFMALRLIKDTRGLLFLQKTSKT